MAGVAQRAGIVFGDTAETGHELGFSDGQAPSTSIPGGTGAWGSPSVAANTGTAGAAGGASSSSGAVLGEAAIAPTITLLDDDVALAWLNGADL